MCHQSRLRNANDRNQECFLETFFVSETLFLRTLVGNVFRFFPERFLRTLFRNFFGTLFRNVFFFRRTFCERFLETPFFRNAFCERFFGKNASLHVWSLPAAVFITQEAEALVTVPNEVPEAEEAEATEPDAAEPAQSAAAEAAEAAAPEQDATEPVQSVSPEADEAEAEVAEQGAMEAEAAEAPEQDATEPMQSVSPVAEAPEAEAEVPDATEQDATEAGAAEAPEQDATEPVQSVSPAAEAPEAEAEVPDATEAGAAPAPERNATEPAEAPEAEAEAPEAPEAPEQDAMEPKSEADGVETEPVDGEPATSSADRVLEPEVPVKAEALKSGVSEPEEAAAPIGLKSQAMSSVSDPPKANAAWVFGQAASTLTNNQEVGLQSTTFGLTRVDALGTSAGSLTLAQRELENQRLTSVKENLCALWHTMCGRVATAEMCVKYAGVCQ